jgi:inhibitor of cysteine peptidase
MTPREPALRLTADDRDARRTALVGDVIEVELPENRTTGFRWEPEVDEEALRPVDDRFTAEAVPRGAPGRRTLTFQAVRPGPARLRLVKRREWQETPHDEYAVELDVQS